MKSKIATQKGFMTKRVTYEDKAKGLISSLVELNGLDVGVVMHSEIEKRVATLLKEQDRDTRHGCAEAVSSSNNIDLAHDACMNYQHQK